MCGCDTWGTAGFHGLGGLFQPEWFCDSNSPHPFQTGDELCVHIPEDTPQVLWVLTALNLRKKTCQRWQCKGFSYYFHFNTGIPRRRTPLLLFVFQWLTVHIAVLNFHSNSLFSFKGTESSVSELQVKPHLALNGSHVCFPLLCIHSKNSWIAFLCSSVICSAKTPFITWQ